MILDDLEGQCCNRNSIGCSASDNAYVCSGYCKFFRVCW